VIIIVRTVLKTRNHRVGLLATSQASLLLQA